MIKYFKFFFFIVLSLTFVACKCPECDEPNGDIVTSSGLERQILGTWEVISGSDDTGEYFEGCVFDFMEYGFLTITFEKGSQNEEIVPCNYTLDGSKLDIDFGCNMVDENFEGIVSIKGDILTFSMRYYDPVTHEVEGAGEIVLKRVK